MSHYFSYPVAKCEAGKTVEDFLKAKGYSHHILVHLKHTEKGICVNDTWVYTNTRLKAGDCVQTLITEEGTDTSIQPVDLPLSIFYEDEDLLIINKAAGMPIHPSMNHHDNTLANAVAYHFQKKQEPFVYRCINRLDRDTSGLLIIAKHMLSAAILSQMSAHREIHREYLAIATGCVPAEGTVDAPIARTSDSVIERCIDIERGERAVTHYKRLDYQNGYSLVSCVLETGRTHQIRVHLKHIGHPLPGDFLYYPDYTVIKRQALHAYRLSFTHPITGEPVTFCAPMPEDMQCLFPDF